MNVNFTPQAQSALHSIRDRIAQDDGLSAGRVASRIRQTIMMVEQFQLFGHGGDVADTRESAVTSLPYLIVYRIASATELDMLTIVHSAQKYT